MEGRRSPWKGLIFGGNGQLCASPRTLSTFFFLICNTARSILIARIGAPSAAALPPEDDTPQGWNGSLRACRTVLGYSMGIRVARSW